VRAIPVRDSLNLQIGSLQVDCIDFFFYRMPSPHGVSTTLLSSAIILYFQISKNMTNIVLKLVVELRYCLFPGDLQVEVALKLSKIEEFTGRSEPTVIT